MIGLLLIAAASAAVAPGSPSGDDVVVRAQIPPHCHRRPDDPLDAAKNLPDKWVTLRLKANGSISMEEGPHYESNVSTWQRAGQSLANYVFRVPTDNSPLCIGSRDDHVPGGAELLRVLDPRDFRGQHIRFTAFAASRNAALVSFWLNGGGGEKQFGRVTWGGTHGWTPVVIDVAVSQLYARTAYGVTLSGGGDVWLYQPRLDIIGKDGKPIANQPDRP